MQQLGRRISIVSVELAHNRIVERTFLVEGLDPFTADFTTAISRMAGSDRTTAMSVRDDKAQAQRRWSPLSTPSGL